MGEAAKLNDSEESENNTTSRSHVSEEKRRLSIRQDKMEGTKETKGIEQAQCQNSANNLQEGRHYKSNRTCQQKLASQMINNRGT